MRYLVAIPVFNEAATLRSVVQEVRKYARDILVIDDGSTDATPCILRAEPCIRMIRHRINHGYGQSLIDAFRFASDHDYDWLVTLDCDEQHEPAAIPDFVRAAEEDDADIISGSRYLIDMAGNSRPPAERRAINQKITDLLNEVLGLNLTDAFCGFKAYRVQALRRLNITVPGYGMPLQLWVQAVREGLRIREIPVRLIYTDKDRFFGGALDDADARLLYYYDVLIHELSRSWVRAGPARQHPQEPCGDCT
ncbi:MAG TPA: glycosyltransferase family 2 protein [Phycisphaerae bacterium]|nr:glycosyltransferase family 2 protein [Phycisphaerae bacterium]HOB75661.1 glycosyltransferase family 2 protein [Phycisphaerae bacterium]HOJ53273.1 glycosyltransferase family 2 protein [Phycisphaerae bacterium]HOL27436.1 glycosyltransferase family 2 protein [Phycisphaerae bacterium]HPP21632.1 glycosyltransferase family 2 protein [Phycisphaerae bacterium]